MNKEQASNNTCDNKARKSIPYCFGQYGQKQGNFVPKNIPALPGRFSCTGELYRISASKFISDRKKTSVSFSLSPSTGNDHYILDLKSGLWTDFGYCCFISLSLSLSLSLTHQTFSFSLSFSVFQTSQMIFSTPKK